MGKESTEALGNSSHRQEVESYCRLPAKTKDTEAYRPAMAHSDSLEESHQHSSSLPSSPQYKDSTVSPYQKQGKYLLQILPPHDDSQNLSCERERRHPHTTTATSVYSMHVRNSTL